MRAGLAVPNSRAMHILVPLLARVCRCRGAHRFRVAVRAEVWPLLLMMTLGVTDAFCLGQADRWQSVSHCFNWHFVIC